MGQEFKLATRVVLITGLVGFAASCSTAKVYSVVPETKPSTEEIAMLTSLQATDTTALASADAANMQVAPVDMATDRTVAMAYAVPQPKPMMSADAAAAVDGVVVQQPVQAAADQLQVIQPQTVMAQRMNTSSKTRGLEIASADPMLLQIQPAAQDPALSVTAAAMVEPEKKTRGLEPYVSSSKNADLDQLIVKYAALYEVPVDLVHHVVRRESNYNPNAVSRGNLGLMQIRYNTAKGMGYDGTPTGLLDAETNLKYAVKYLRGAWLVADRDHKKADWLYRTGYYYQAKKKKLLKATGLQ